MAAKLTTTEVRQGTGPRAIFYVLDRFSDAGGDRRDRARPRLGLASVDRYPLIGSLPDQI